MKTKNVRVRIADIKHGRIIYVSHPFFGIEKYTVESRPYRKTYDLFFDVKSPYFGGYSKSIDDCGISNGESYNDRRTFFKERQAKEWVDKMSKDPQAIARHQQHLQSCAKIKPRKRVRTRIDITTTHYIMNKLSKTQEDVAYVDSRMD